MKNTIEKQIELVKSGLATNRQMLSLFIRDKDASNAHDCSLAIQKLSVRLDDLYRADGCYVGDRQGK